MAKNLLHCETGFGVYRSTQLGHIPFFFITISVGWPKYRIMLLSNLKCSLNLPEIEQRSSDWSTLVINYKKSTTH
jgi:hypothetical protein